MPRLLALAVALLLVAPASGKAEQHHRRPNRGKRYVATRIARAYEPKIDGRLDDEAWKHVQPDSRFTQNFPDEDQAPSQRTELYVAYDDKALYIAVRCWDSDPAGIVERLTRRDRDTDADKITVDISSKNDRTTAFHFDVNVSGVLVDGVRFNDTDYSSDWDGLWLGAAHKDAHGWSAELSIPFSTLRYEGGRTEFGFQVRRMIERRQEIDEWAYTPRSARGEVSYYGVLEGLAGLHTARLFQVMPYLAQGTFVRYGQEPSALNGTQLYGNVGADLKLGITPALTLDATFNPDFGQVEADQVVLNLTTFEVLYPEKRPFFLEGVDVFATPISLFYSRRIGRQAPTPGSYELSQPMPQGRIWGAAKLTGIVAPRLTIGVLDAVTDSTTVTVTGHAGEARAVTTDPMANYAVFRLKRDILSHSYVGVTATAVTRFEQPFAAAPAPGDLCPADPQSVTSSGPTAVRGRCTHDAYTGGADALLLTKDGTWGLKAHVAGSVIVGGPARQVADGTVIGAGDAGLGMLLDAAKQGGRLLTAVHYEGYSPKFDINDVGYNRQANLHYVHYELGWRIIKPTGVLLEGNLYTGTNLKLSWSGDAVLQRTGFVSTWLRFKNYWALYAEADYDLGHDDNRETRDGAITQRVGGPFGSLWFKTDPRRRLVLEGQAWTARVRRGEAWDGSLTLHLRVIPPLELDVIPHGSWTYGDPRWFDTVDNDNGTRSYYFADLESEAFDVTLRGTYTFIPTLTLQAYTQLFVDGGHYGLTSVAEGVGPRPYLRLRDFTPAAMPAGQSPDFRDGTINVNVVLRWEFSPGSTIILVYTHAQNQLPFSPGDGIGAPSFGRFSTGPATDLVLLKLSLLVS